MQVFFHPGNGTCEGILSSLGLFLRPKPREAGLVPMLVIAVTSGGVIATIRPWFLLLNIRAHSQEKGSTLPSHGNSAIQCERKIQGAQ